MILLIFRQVIEEESCNQSLRNEVNKINLSDADTMIRDGVIIAATEYNYLGKPSNKYALYKSYYLTMFTLSIFLPIIWNMIGGVCSAQILPYFGVDGRWLDQCLWQKL